MRLTVADPLVGAEVVIANCLFTVGCTEATLVILLAVPITGAATAILFTVLGVVRVLVG